LETETHLVFGGLESSEARQFLAAMPIVEELMPPLSLENLGVTRWQPPEDAATQLTTPRTPADRRRRRILRAIEANPTASDARLPRSPGATTRPSPCTAGVGNRVGNSPLTGELPAAEAGDDE